MILPQAEIEAMLVRELRTVLARLELVSQAPVQNLGPSTRDESESIGGKRPPGALDHAGDREPDFPQKSVEHFRRRLARARTRSRLEAILRDAKTALEAWKRQPAPTGEPKLSSPQWKRWVAESDLPAAEIARKFNVKRQYVSRIRSEYRDAA